MLKLSIMSEEELSHIFGDLDSYIPLHEGKNARPFLAKSGFLQHPEWLEAGQAQGVTQKKKIGSRNLYRCINSFALR